MAIKESNWYSVLDFKCKVESALPKMTKEQEAIIEKAIQRMHEKKFEKLILETLTGESVSTCIMLDKVAPALNKLDMDYMIHRLEEETGPKVNSILQWGKLPKEAFQTISNFYRVDIA